MLLTAHFPRGQANLVLTMNTGSYLGTVVKRIPFIVDNPAFGKPVEELAETKKLRDEFGKATVVELFMDAALPQWNIQAYDGARDVYFGDGRGMNFGGSCQNIGNHISYGTELRYRLDVGGESRRTLIRYDLSMLPPGTEVEKALLALDVHYLDKKADLNCRAFALRKRWHETIIGVIGGLNDGNGPSRAKYPVGAIELWEEPLYQGRSDRHPEPVASFEFKEPGWLAIDVTPAVENWLSGKWENHGLALETVKEAKAYGKRFVSMTASDAVVDPSKRPRLILALKGKPKAVAHAVKAKGGDPEKALGKAGGKLVVVNVLSAGSLTSRNLETKVLARPEVTRFLAADFVEVRIDGGNAKHAKFLKDFGVKRLPTTLVVGPKDADGNRPFDIIEPFDWNALFGAMRSDFEFEQIYTGRLKGLLDRYKRDKRLQWALTAGGEIVGGDSVACGQ